MQLLWLQLLYTCKYLAGIYGEKVSRRHIQAVLRDFRQLLSVYRVGLPVQSLLGIDCEKALNDAYSHVFPHIIYLPCSIHPYSNLKWKMWLSNHWQLNKMSLLTGKYSTVNGLIQWHLQKVEATWHQCQWPNSWVHRLVQRVWQKLW